MKQKSAVEWLKKELENYGSNSHLSLDWDTFDELCEQAKEKEKEQHGQTWDGALDAGENRAWNVMRAYSDFDDYYEKTYEK
jgi:ABC-type glycerol-3-phosphate transport system substrate-binding protein